jgi:CRP/FNR family transcriptional regulator, cyclic AMP receptor protein
MARNDNITAQLQEISIFAGCTKKELNEISRLATEVAVKEGQVLTREGEHGIEFGIVLSGTASVMQKGIEVNRLEAGGHYGEMALIDDGPRTATIVATSPMSIAVVARPEFGQLLDEVPQLAVAIMRSLARRLRELDDHPGL